MGDDDEWDDYRENKKDYTGLKIENLVIEEPVKVEEEETEINEDGEVVKVKKDESGPWNKKDGVNRGSIEQQETPEPEVKPSNHIIVATPSPPPLSARLSVTSRRSSAMLPLTSSRRCPLLLPPPPLRSLMSFPTARSSPSAMSVSVALRLSSSLPSLEWKPAASTRPPITPS